MEICEFTIQRYGKKRVWSILKLLMDDFYKHIGTSWMFDFTSTWIRKGNHLRWKQMASFFSHANISTSSEMTGYASTHIDLRPNAPVTNGILCLQAFQIQNHWWSQLGMCLTGNLASWDLHMRRLSSLPVISMEHEVCTYSWSRSGVHTNTNGLSAMTCDSAIRVWCIRLLRDRANEGLGHEHWSALFTCVCHIGSSSLININPVVSKGYDIRSSSLQALWRISYCSENRQLSCSLCFDTIYQFGLS